MTVLIVAIGSRGDVVPYVGLGARLRAAGYPVAVAAHEPFGELVKEAGLEFRAVPGDVHALNERVLVSARLGERREKLSMKVKGELLTAYWREVAAGILAAVRQGADLLLPNFTAWLPAWQIAQAMGLPSLGINAYPVHTTADHPPISLGTTRSFGRLGNRIAGRLTNWTVAQALLLKDANNDLRGELGLRPAGVAAVVRELDAARWPILHGYSPTLLPRPADWRPGLDVVGFWWPYRAPGPQAPPELEAFLDDGPPPVFFGFGSTAHGDDERTAAMIVDALRRAGLRGVVQAGWDSPGDDVLTVREVLPYEWLFPRVSAAVHHAGVGTLAHGLRAATPTVSMPLINDQYLWAARAAALGVGPAVLPFGKATAGRLADAIEAAVTRPAYRDNARAVAGRIQDEDGVRPVLEAVRRLLG